MHVEPSALLGEQNFAPRWPEEFPAFVDFLTPQVGRPNFPPEPPPGVRRELPPLLEPAWIHRPLLFRLEEHEIGVVAGHNRAFHAGESG